MNLGTFGLRDSQASPNKDMRVFLTVANHFFFYGSDGFKLTISRTKERFLSGGFLMVQFLLINGMVINTNRHANTLLI